MTGAAPACAAGPPPGIVDIWCVHLDVPASVHAALVATLDAPEREHAARMRIGGRAWAAARGAQRMILASYLGVAANALRFCSGAAGKPRLVDAQGLEFSFSRTEGLGVLAVAGDREVGVDVERENGRTDVERVAREFLPPDEVAVLGAMRPERRRSAFFSAWTRYEARLKLHGGGLTGASAPAQVATAAPAHVRALALPPGFAGAVAAAGGMWTLRVRRFGGHVSACHAGRPVTRVSR